MAMIACYSLRYPHQRFSVLTFLLLSIGRMELFLRRGLPCIIPWFVIECCFFQADSINEQRHCRFGKACAIAGSEKPPRTLDLVIYCMFRHNALMFTLSKPPSFSMKQCQLVCLDERFNCNFPNVGF